MGEFRVEMAKLATARLGFKALLAAEGGTVSARKAALLYDRSQETSEEAIRQAARNRQVIAIPDGQGRLRFPRWQFGNKGGVLPGIREVLTGLKKHPLSESEPMLPVTFLLNHRARLGGKRPLDVLRLGTSEGLKSVLGLIERDSE